MIKGIQHRSKVIVSLFGLMLAPAQVVGQSAPTPPAPAAPPANFGCPGPEYKQFHFMLGEWKAGSTTSQTPPQQNAKWSLLSNGCTILESWRVGSGNEGHSLNYYDQADGKWHQIWVDSTGDATHYVGSFTNGKMEFVADDITTPTKTNVKRTMTFEPMPDGRVQQSGTESRDGGKTFIPSFHLTYQKAAK